jgi:hypothetical protein
LRRYSTLDQRGDTSPIVDDAVFGEQHRDLIETLMVEEERVLVHQVDDGIFVEQPLHGCFHLFGFHGVSVEPSITTGFREVVGLVASSVTTPTTS